MHPARNTTAHCTTGLRGGHHCAHGSTSTDHRPTRGQTRRGWGAALAVALLVLMPASSVSHAAPGVGAGASTGGTWTPTGYMITARYGHTATLLPDGQVLVAGGCADSTCGGAFASAELYDPRTGTWAYTGSMHNARLFHTATLLPNGQVLVAGGDSMGNTAELYDPHTGTWSATGSMVTARTDHTATLLPDGQVLVTGGCCFTASAELYNPHTGTWTPTGSMSTVRQNFAAALLANGKVLVTGGDTGPIVTLTSAELYDPRTGTWSATGSMNSARLGHTETLLPDGNVLVAGGCHGSASCRAPNPSAELYDPATGTWRATGSLITTRAFHTATLLSDGQVLVAGGFNVSNTLASAELYDPNNGTWTATGSMAIARYDHRAALLLNEQVLVAGGTGSNNSTGLASAELYTPAPPLPTLEVTPTSGVYQQPITLRGAHFAPAEVVNVYANATNTPPLYSTTADAAGAFVLRTSAQQGVYGWQRLVAVGQSSGRTALTRFFNRPSLVLAPSSGAVGMTVRVQGDGFGADEPVQVQWNTPRGPVLGSALSDGRGHVATTVTVPASTAGAHQVWGVGQDSGAQAYALFTVT